MPCALSRMLSCYRIESTMADQCQSTIVQSFASDLDSMFGLSSAPTGPPVEQLEQTVEEKYVSGKTFVALIQSNCETQEANRHLSRRRTPKTRSPAPRNRTATRTSLPLTRQLSATANTKYWRTEELPRQASIERSIRKDSTSTESYTDSHTTSSKQTAKYERRHGNIDGGHAGRHARGTHTAV